MYASVVDGLQAMSDRCKVDGVGELVDMGNSSLAPGRKSSYRMVVMITRCVDDGCGRVLRNEDAR